MAHQLANSVTLKKITWGYIAFLLLSASFSRQALAALTRLTGVPVIHAVPWILLTGIFLLTLSYQTLRKRRVIEVFWLVLSMTGIYLFMKSMRNPDERIHLFQYGILGFMVMMEKRVWPFWKAFAFAFFVALATACADETFQAFLPYRVGDIRDVGFGIVGGCWGAFIGWIWERGRTIGRHSTSSTLSSPDSL